MAARSQANASPLGRYEVITPLASGGMAEVFLARLAGPGAFQRPVVIKRMHPHLARDAEFVSMFLDEARIVSAVRHPNVVHVHDFLHDGEELVMVLEYVEGETLAQLVRATSRGFPLDRVLAAHVIAEACAGLHAAHELTDASGAPLHVVHRDVSPQNVMVTYDGHVKVLDFGIAKANARQTRTETGQVKGKEGYMSPEQCLGKPLDRRSDVFSLGVLLFELLVGEKLFASASSLLVLKAICEDDIPSPRDRDLTVPAGLDAICRRALSRAPGDRYATALEMRRDLLDCIHELAGAQLHSETLARWMRRAFADRAAKKHGLLASESAAARYQGAHERVPLRRRTRAIVATCALSTVALLGWQLRHALHAAPASSAGSASPQASGAAAVSAVPVAASATSAPQTASSTIETSFASVSIEVRSLPPGARITAGGAKLGVTPTTLRLPRGTASVQLVLTRDGYATTTENVTPDKDQRILLQLPPRLHKSGAAPPSPSSPSPFQRFD